MEMGRQHSGLIPSQNNLKRLMRFTIKVFAVVFVILSIGLLIWGLLPHDRVVRDKNLSGGFSYGHAINAYKDDKVIIDYEIDGNDAAFYLTYAVSYREGNRDYIIEVEHAYINHFEIDVKKSGLYWLNFESNGPFSETCTGEFTVDLKYRVQSRYSPVHISFGIISVIIGGVMIVLYSRVKERPQMIRIEECEQIGRNRLR